ncbi:bifunctional diaminohydroxyphosphoribosylaminopyrimidine deaminase/5-amino-6-(5-phosphoribosylamino)uracil reductase RibD [Ethanoligenens harbinense]|uniref:Riboflavin biosynthesis protein RibD n=1 Tax=Ethanoligenens harbinense (strain DSM 18485 / JCM 12961 / CGMCC 1.5033 / YUAN-3) TaxID=663278 RepID=E6U9U3_ETHHY|nr:bifunctional diaminohydroxyphosphoribosylaminopyrimidine deaminase/5-amino-6-(5-phosphoribosylamino)uracil reductase RibD [Ethanoligenens harbinense]ADU26209.1 riboflavin biosynthesis protein RibD [Ethanoligenens harbinense YUAN-3]AVQ95346.1 bifunctional diaminohydroxyphosphoribosylaminopyrimidine deaminase/5-amino-6-(5-phosphoribosylamino)uracil reductase RibD [Ethanoligenens harbinense YUAN-3]AYF38011.1 bifunctional diaminohydroxyphosphoribosylaminopyrimidine deaminase/5-amino-6-(5-phosphor
MSDETYMKLALEYAEKGCGWVNPNPMVGAVVVKDGRVIGTGWHRRYGELHAERNALASCTEPPQGATLYVTLEPCCHYGKTPPCTDAILESGIHRVVVGSVDPNPLVAGKGIRILRQRGIEVAEGVLGDACTGINEVFFHFIRTRMPYVVMKYAMTMDGKIATCSGQSKWITGETARRRTQEDRHRYSGIMVGIGTVLTDDPLLTCRLPDGRNPVRIVCDSRLRTPLNAQIVRITGEAPTILVTCSRDEALAYPYRDAGCEVLTLPAKDGHVDLRALMTALGKKGIDSVLLEGGGALNWSALQSGIVNKVQAYVAPKLFGGINAKSPVAGMGVESPEQAFRLASPQVTRLGEDILLESEVLSCSQES